MTRKLLVALVITGCTAVAVGQTRRTNELAAPPGGEARSGLSLREFDTSLQEVSNKVQRAVVQVLNSAFVIQDGEGGDGATASVERSSGSGILISADGYIVTNAHVVRDSHRLRVRLNPAVAVQGSHLVEARVIGIDFQTDIAVIKIERTGLPFLDFADSDHLHQGQIVLAFGSPLGLDNSVSMGVVSAVDRQLDEDSPLVFIQTDAAINPGNSGGPLVNTAGQVVGINTFILSKSGGNEGLGFAIPSNLANSICRQIRTEHHVHHHEIGIGVRAITPELFASLGLATEEGVLIEDVAPQGPADQAGIKTGDVIVCIGDRPITNVRQLALNMYRYNVGDRVPICIMRGTEKMSLAVPLQEVASDPQNLQDLAPPEQNSIAEFGILGLSVDEKLAAMVPPLRMPSGVLVVARIRARGDFAGDDFVTGDVIHAINGAAIRDIPSLKQALQSLTSNTQALVVQVERLGRLKFVVLERN